MNRIFLLSVSGLLALALGTAPSVFAQKKSLRKNASTSVVPSAAPSAQEQIITNLRAFTKLYGYVRYFHPSDEAMRLQWDKFAVYGAAKVKSAQNTKELKAVLEELFLPIAPTLQIYERGLKLPPRPALQSNASWKSVAWQHKGVGLGVQDLYGVNTPYRSVSVNSPERSEAKYGIVFHYITSSTSPTIQAVQGKFYHLRFSVAIRTDIQNPENGAIIGLEASFLGGGNWPAATPDAEKIISKEWKEYEISGFTKENTVTLLMWAEFCGKGRIWLDNARLWKAEKQIGPWTEVPLENGGFEQMRENNTAPVIVNTLRGSELWNTPFPHWQFRKPKSYIVRSDTVNPYQGKYCLRLEDSESFQKEELFDAKPFDGEILRKNLGGGIECALPLTLQTDGKILFGSTTTSTAAFRSLLKDSLKNTVVTEKPYNKDAIRLANVIMAWNVLQHFYPYFDDVPTNWDSTLTATLLSTLQCQSAEEFERIMRKMLVGLKDGHAEYYRAVPHRIVPALIENVEGKPVVIASEDKRLQQGDILLSVDDKSAPMLLAEEEALVSGSVQYKRAEAAHRLTMAESNKARVSLARGSDTLSFVVERKPELEVNLYEHTAIQRISGSEEKDTVWYIDLAQVSVAEIEAKANEFAQAKGIVFDMRGYPKDGNAEILGYVTDSALLSPRYLVPQIIYPDHENVQGYDTSRLSRVQPKLPRWKGKCVFLTGGGAISQAEDIMSMVEHYKLGKIVDEATAGADGNVNMLYLPGGNKIRWTGMKVLKHDGSQLHGIGIQPTHPASRTLQGMRGGQDEVLEKALLLLH